MVMLDFICKGTDELQGRPETSEKFKMKIYV